MTKTSNNSSSGSSSSNHLRQLLQSPEGIEIMCSSCTRHRHHRAMMSSTPLPLRAQSKSRDTEPMSRACTAVLLRCKRLAVSQNHSRSATSQQPLHLCHHRRRHHHHRHRHRAKTTTRRQWAAEKGRSWPGHHRRNTASIFKNSTRQLQTRLKSKRLYAP